MTPDSQESTTYRLIFVDDEDIVREGIRSRIDWGDNGYDLVGVFGDGQQALDYLRTNPVDVVLSDISMPRLDGLALSKAIASEFPDMLVLLLTGYDEFEYAQEALQYRVREFLLKPITADELSQVLQQTRVALDQNREQRLNQAALMARLRDSFPLLRERFFYQMVSGRLPADDVRGRADLLEWQDLRQIYQILVIAFTGEWSDIVRFAMSEAVRADLSQSDEVFANRDDDLVVLLQGATSEGCLRRASALGQSAMTTAARVSDGMVSVGIGLVVQTTGELPRSYRGARMASDYARVLGL